MKRSLYAILGTAAFVAVAISVTAQSQTTQTTSTSSGYVQTTKIVGTTVKTAQGEQVGVVKDVILDRNTGCIAYTVLSAGGTGETAKMVAVPWTVYSSTEPGSFVVNVERERIYNAPVFEYSRISEYSTTGYIDNVDSYFGISAGVGRSQATMGGTTGSNTQGRAHTSPSETASPGTAASPSPARGTSERPAPSARATATAAREQSPRESASPKGRRGKGHEEMTPEKTKARATPGAERRRTESSRQRAEESPAETRERPSTEREQGTPEPNTRGTGEPSATPEER